MVLKGYLREFDRAVGVRLTKKVGNHWSTAKLGLNWSTEDVIMRTIQGFSFPMRNVFVLLHKCHSVKKTLHLSYCSSISECMRPLKKTVAVDKENTALARGPSASDNTASSNKNKASCKSRPFRDRQTQGTQKPTTRQSSEYSDGYKTVQEIATLTVQPVHRQHAENVH